MTSEKRKATQRASVAKNKRHYQNYFYKYYRENWAQAVVNRLRARARRCGLPFDLVAADVPPIPDVCPVLGISFIFGRGGNNAPLPNSPSVDRRDPEKGYVKGNICIISQRANTIRGDATVEELERVLQYARSIV